MTDAQRRAFDLINALDLFYYGTPEQEEAIVRKEASMDGGREFWTEEEIQDHLREVRDLQCVLNMNDTFGWALAWGEKVPDEDLEEVARLVRTYGSHGAVYYVSEKNGRQRSEFADVQRGIDFVRIEETVRREHPGSSERAYFKTAYTLGGDSQ